MGAGGEGKRSAECRGKRIVGSGQLAVGAGLKRILLLRFLCFRKIFGTGFIMNMCNFLIGGGSSLWWAYFVIVDGWCIFIEKVEIVFT